MGFSVSASTALIFAALFLSFGIFYPAMVNSVERVNDARSDQADDLLDQQNTEIEFGDIDDGGQPGTIDVNNIGTTTLSANGVDLFINGEYRNRSDYTTEIDGNADTDVWAPGQTLTITEDDFEEGDDILVVTDNGISIRTEA